MTNPEEKELILHIGQSKTGTTTLQQTFKKNKGFLESQGILYPMQSSQYNHKLLVPLWSRSSVQGAIQRLNLGSVEDQVKFAEKKWPEVMDRFMQPHIRQLVISPELMFDRCQCPDQGRCLCSRAYRVSVCRDGAQWLFQRQRDRFQAGGAVWDTLGCYVSKFGLIRLVRVHIG